MPYELSVAEICYPLTAVERNRIWFPDYNMAEKLEASLFSDDSLIMSLMSALFMNKN
jgi:hypothetical protein